ncbi:MAG: ABC transporter ATP-binding protein [Coprothermobacterota bacterium]|jgi:iron complex transport system ATP-binding protein|nr:ABC transporter ATP-binding protein [Coprothermobacterota bacterium]
MIALEAKKLCAGYPPRRAVLHEIDLDLPAGQVTAILGPNGSGKTTLLHALIGLVPRASGEVRFSGKLLQSYTRRELSRHVGLVPQEERVAFEFTVLEYVLFGRAPHLGPLQTPGREDVEMALQALARTGVEALRERRLPSLSGGERQLAVIARALAQEPQVLLLDEPIAHLDLGNHGRLRSLLRELARNGTAICFTAHDPNFAASCADRLLLLRGGRVVAEGPLNRTFQEGLLSEVYGIPLRVLRREGWPLLVES